MAKVTRSEKTLELLRVPDDVALREACARGDLTSLRVWMCKIKDFSPIANLTQLKRLVIADWPHPDLAIIGRLKRLNHLEILHPPKVSDLSPLADLPLKTLEIRTLPSWNPSGKTLVLDTLEPIGKLLSLRRLVLSSISVRNGGLYPLGRLKNAQKVFVSNNFPIEEVAYLAAHLPKPARPSPFEETQFECRKCQGMEVMLVGRWGKRRSYFACSHCRAKYIQEHVEEFERLRSKASLVSPA